MLILAGLYFPLARPVSVALDVLGNQIMQPFIITTLADLSCCLRNAGSETLAIFLIHLELHPSP
jgi:hypothetical protein